MLLRTSKLLQTPIMSLQVGKEIARTSKVLVDPADLKIIAFELEGESLDEVPSFLRIQDTRELSDIGFIVDSSDEFVGLDDVISLQKIYELQFNLVGLRVIDTHKQKLGKVYDSVFNTNSFTVEQLCVKRPILQSLGDTELLIHSRQIVEVNDTDVIVRAPNVKIDEARQDTTNSGSRFNNPFKDTRPAPSTETSTRL